MCYWFSGQTVLSLVVGVLFLIVGILGGGYWFNWASVVGGALVLIGIYGVARRRYAVARFNLVFGFMPGDQAHEPRFRHLVEKEIRSRADSLDNAYRALDQACDAAKTAMDATHAAELLREYRRTEGHANTYRRQFYGAIDTVTSKWLPVPYSGISRNVIDWKVGKPNPHHI